MIVNPKSRINSILNTEILVTSITGLPSFDLLSLELPQDLEFQIPNNIRLGHIAEKVVSLLIQSSSNYHLLYENMQIVEEKKTIGEIDFIIEEIKTQKRIHVELAYKFYLYDPAISSEPLKNWIGPNRKDALHTKLEKLKEKQFPLLKHDLTKVMLKDIDINKVSPALCLLVSLFVPYQYKGAMSPFYKKAIKGYYLNYEQFVGLHIETNSYYIPEKKEWGIEPSENKNWDSLKSVQPFIKERMKEEQAVLCWQKSESIYSAFFIVWW